MPAIPALWEAKAVDHLRSGVQDQPDQHSETPSLLTQTPSTNTNPVSKNIKISWVWWRTPVVTVTWEAEAGESLKPRRWRLQ